MNQNTQNHSEVVDVTSGDIQQLRNFVFASIISAENDEYDEEIKQEVIHRYDLFDSDPDWEYVLQPLGDDAHSYIDFFQGAV